MGDRSPHKQLRKDSLSFWELTKELVIRLDDMVSQHLLRWPDLLAIAINLSVMVGIGIYSARRTNSADGYFLANRSMPGWIVGFSLMATIISSMTFLAVPGFTFEKDWRYMPAHFLYIIPAIIAYFLFMPYFRRGHVRSAYEYLELRFSTWARLYTAGSFLIFQMFRTGVILYAVCLPLGPMTGLPLHWIIIVLGILVASYTVAGGLEAVIYTDLLQSLALILGGLICIPLAIRLIPGGLSQVFSEAVADGKFSLGNTAMVWDEQTVWVLILVYQFTFFQLVCTDQNAVQRYIAMKTDRDAKHGLILSTIMIIPVWFYFAFIGTVLYVYYKYFPAPELDNLVSEQAFPFFILTQLPAGAAGFVLSGLLAAAMSTLDSGINASAATITNDFYRRFKKSIKDEQHYLKFGRWVSVGFGAIMILVALFIHFTRTQTLLDLQTLVFSVVSGGLVSIFLLGFLTVRVDSRAALIATLCTISTVCLWLFADSNAGTTLLPGLKQVLPNKFWIIVLSNLFLFTVAYSLSFLLGSKGGKNLRNLTVWTSSEKE